MTVGFIARSNTGRRIK